LVIGALATAVVALAALVVVLLLDGGSEDAAPVTQQPGNEAAGSGIASQAATEQQAVDCVFRLPTTRQPAVFRPHIDPFDCAEGKQVVETWLLSTDKAADNGATLEVGRWVCHAYALNEAPKIGRCASHTGSFEIEATKDDPAGPAPSGADLTVRAPQPEISSDLLEQGGVQWELGYSEDTKFALAQLFLRSQPRLCRRVEAPEELVYYVDNTWDPPKPTQRNGFYVSTLADAMAEYCALLLPEPAYDY